MLNKSSLQFYLAILALTALLLLMLAACSGGGPSGEDRETRRPVAEESEGSERERDRIGSQPRATEEELEEDDGSEPTRRGILRRSGSQTAGAEKERESLAVLPPDATSTETDREALTALYHAADGPDWEYSANWLTDEPLGDWKGVTTDENGRVIELKITLVLGPYVSSQVKREIPPELGNLAHLTVLNLTGNKLSGEIPPELGNLGNLTVLELFDNELSGEVPPELGNLGNLTYLYLEANRLSGGECCYLRGQIPRVGLTSAGAGRISD